VTTPSRKLQSSQAPKVSNLSMADNPNRCSILSLTPLEDKVCGKVESVLTVVNAHRPFFGVNSQGAGRDRHQRDPKTFHAPHLANKNDTANSNALYIPDAKDRSIASLHGCAKCIVYPLLPTRPAFLKIGKDIAIKLH
jgi:hypothetical protein